MSPADAERGSVRETLRALWDAIEDMDQKMAPYGAGEFVDHYVLPASPWHRILGLVRGGLWPGFVQECLDERQGSQATIERLESELASLRQREAALRDALVSVLPAAHYYLERLEAESNGVPEDGEGGDRAWWEHYRSTERHYRAALAQTSQPKSEETSDG